MPVNQSTPRLRPSFFVAKLRMPVWPPGEADHIKEGLRKAGLT